MPTAGSWAAVRRTSCARAPRRRGAAWQAAGRDGEPRIVALAYFAFGEGAAEAADGYLRHYYEWLGEYAGMVADSAATDVETLKQYVAGFADAGCDELITFPSSPDVGQVDLLADAVLT